MAINVARIKTVSDTLWAVVTPEGYQPVPGDYPTTGDFVRNGRDRAFKVAQENGGGLIPFSDAQCLCPITQNQQYICQGANYVSHMLEAGLDPNQKGYNMIFRKASSCLAPADTDIIRPDHVSLLDYELELGLVLARDITGPKTVSEDTLDQFVAGLVITNDVSARCVQIPQMQFYKGKSYRTFGPTGPLVDAS
ncbi:MULTISPECIES: fumarylacetoacetate hydrolase family protein [Kordiimonas]|jgi:2-keto-4-pentenoate hydratase/2-oxohepta-3-ene-1,7-dioic acid hydratase in catechol pathway|uniref:fumarylacetoacetate hydrolase family protein n=1 Tax=Kordiimonas TaxID=288021 RepID=UPI00257C6F82|nr:fumarylacetoacetate hydrolase family protein [Kordiimonas sp. UBA4487]